ncbi:hypothetical protein [Nitrosomonas communis]|uniref:Uncharacterized protein n=1 Tax=Nitrosomonas communis TaxID=44574 RepID=A0A1I4VQB5_9PROT|nr:hypothetical protein [Nitrosomonas communis]SFN03350.1 hypothetical protein SAMN05421863_10889 [Nitrosomonas communis]
MAARRYLKIIEIKDMIPILAFLIILLFPSIEVNAYDAVTKAGHIACLKKNG